MIEPIPAIMNCKQLIIIGSQSLINLSTVRIWHANKIEQINKYISPIAILEKLPTKHKKIKPIKAIPIETQQFHDVFFLNNSPNKGTNKIYNAKLITKLT